jgi:UDP-N-acetylglucosamine 1-carboxyvinyltransferase
MPDRNEAVSYACAAIATKGDIIVENAMASHLHAFLQKLDEMGAGYEVGSYGIRFYYKGKLQAVQVETQPHPGFMTDWQPLFAVLLTQAEGKSMIHETVSENRFQYVGGLRSLGAQIRLFNPDVKNPDKTYNFTYHPSDSIMHAAEILGPTKLQGTEFDIPDLRAGATMVLGALVASGTTKITNVAHIDRGYEELDTRLRSMGAQIVRTNT